jgi:hypothetical protein
MAINPAVTSAATAEAEAATRFPHLSHHLESGSLSCVLLSLSSFQDRISAVSLSIEEEIESDWWSLVVAGALLPVVLR